MKFSQELITPERAKDLLEMNVQNRVPKLPVVKRYAEEMKNGKWKEGTAECIKIAKSGRILDGQQRLMAIIQAKVSINLVLATELDEDIFDVLDTGTKRSAVDTFSSKGIKYASSLPSIISFSNDLKNGFTQRGQNIHKKSTNNKLLEQYLEDELFWGMIANTTYNWYLQFAKIMQPSLIGGFYAYFYSIDPEAAKSFMEQLTLGVNIQNETINALRQRLLEDRVSMLKMQFSHKTALILKTWNYFRSNQTTKSIKYDPAKEEFPIAI
jgi:hypothetical protein